MDQTEGIKQVITDFVKGGDTGNVTLLNSVLHNDFTVASNNFMGTEGITIINKKEYLSKIKSGEFGGIPRKFHIENIDQNESIASVKLRIESSEFDFMSYNSVVLDTDQNWKIIHNLAVVKAK